MHNMALLLLLGLTSTSPDRAHADEYPTGTAVGGVSLQERDLVLNDARVVAVGDAGQRVLDRAHELAEVGLDVGPLASAGAQPAWAEPVALWSPHDELRAEHARDVPRGSVAELLAPRVDRGEPDLGLPPLQPPRPLGLRRAVR